MPGTALVCRLRPSVVKAVLATVAGVLAASSLSVWPGRGADRLQPSQLTSASCTYSSALGSGAAPAATGAEATLTVKKPSSSTGFRTPANRSAVASVRRWCNDRQMPVAASSTSSR